MELVVIVVAKFNGCTIYKWRVRMSVYDYHPYDGQNSAYYDCARKKVDLLS